MFKILVTSPVTGRDYFVLVGARTGSQAVAAAKAQVATWSALTLALEEGRIVLA